MGLTGKEKISCLEDIAENIDETESSDQRDDTKKEKSGSTRVFPLDTFHIRQPQVRGDKVHIEKLTVKRS